MQVNVAGLRRNLKNLAHNYTDAQVKVREATSNDPWGPSATIMAEIADLTHNVVAFSEIMQMIWKRLNDHGKNWRHVYKALILLEYLIKTGTEKVAQQCKENIFAIQTLREFVYYEEGKDQGTHVREKAKQLVILLKDDERLKNERIKALKAKERFAQHPSGFGSDGYIDGPTHRDMPPGWQEEPKPISELEMVRPQTAGEEELQLQLAMAMSREEAEQEEAKRKSDDVRLQLALSQSEQDFKQQGRKEEPQSHLLDLLDISLGATSISSPPLGAAGGMPMGDPWTHAPARAASQLSDPWSGTSSPQIDPWQPAAALRANAGSAPLGAVGGMGMGTNGDSWPQRTQSPSLASGSSTEGWLHSNGGAMNGNSHAAGVDPWITKTIAPLAATAPAPAANTSPLDPWLSDSAKSNAAAAALTMVPASSAPVDPWALKAPVIDDDPWRSIGNAGAKKPSPDLDDFDLITNRNKTGDFITNNSTIGPNNNNASLLDEMDPLSLSNTSMLSGTTINNAKKSFKTPQAFLGENSSLVNLDNLIKPVVPQTQSSAAYNPFSETVVPPKTNLFQQQQPAVPSINQLKQQQPFAMAMSQDPWAPVANNTNVTSQLPKEKLINFDSEEINLEFHSRPTTLNLQTSSVNRNNVANSTNPSGSSFMGSANTLYDVFSAGASCSFGNIYNDAMQAYNPNIDKIRDMQITADRRTDCDAFYAQAAVGNASQSNSYAATPYNHQMNGNYDNFGAHVANVYTPAPAGSAPSNLRYATALTASLAEMPGITVAAPTENGGSLFNYGFYQANATNSMAGSQANCKQENNNNMPWMKAETSPSNPFLS